jgi:hypothetical protein
MDFSKMKWTKNVNHKGDDYWAYQNIDQDLKVFRLNWKTKQAHNASKPKEGELILLRQRSKVTHIVKLLNNTLYEDPNYGEYGMYRFVQAVWIAGTWSLPPEQDMVFAYHLHLEGGQVMDLETLPTFKSYWDNKGGLEGFQKHVLKVLNITI